MKKKSLIHIILSRHGVTEEVQDQVSAEIENLVEYQQKHSDMLQKVIDTMTIDIDNYKTELELSQEKMVKQSKMSTIGEVTATLSHEINNQLMSLNANCELIELVNESQTKNKSIQKSLESVQKTVHEISKLIKNIRKFSFHSSNEVLDMTLDSPVSLISEAVNVSNQFFKNGRINLIKDIQVEESFKFLMPSSELGQVLLNLIKNSNDHIVSLPAEDRWIKIKCTKDEDNIRISVSNTGVMPPDVKQKLFQPFFTTKEIGKGTGIGLSLSKKILESIHGRIFLDESEPGICFTLEIPIVAKAPEVKSKVA